MSGIFQIALDGPSGAGKSTIAKALAEALDIDYIDTGAMYRAVGYKLLRDGVDMNDPAALQKLLDSTDIDFSAGRTLLDGEDISGYIRTQAISDMASRCSAIAAVRKKLVQLQQAMGESKSVVMDGRDIATVVFPKAEYKYYITATAEERANRRLYELRQKGEDVSFEQVLADMQERDLRDSTREVTPLRKAEDAVEIDTTSMTLEQVVDYITKEVK